MRVVLVGFVLCACVCVPCLADVVTMKRGGSVTCRIVGFQKQKLVVEVGGERRSVPMSNVESFEIGTPSQTNDPNALSLASAEIGSEGVLRATLKVETAEDGRFIGTASTKSVIIQGVDTNGLVTGRWVRLEQKLKVVGTENAAGGNTLFVLEPIDKSQTAVLRAENPALSAPVSGGVRVRDVRTPR